MPTLGGIVHGAARDLERDQVGHVRGDRGAARRDIRLQGRGEHQAGLLHAVIHLDPESRAFC